MAVLDYLKETRGELKHVSWATRKQTVAYTTIVIGISLALAIYLGIFDFIFTRIIKLLLI